MVVLKISWCGIRFFRAPGGLTAENDAGCVNCCGSCAPPSTPGGVQQAWRVNPDYNWTESEHSQPDPILFSKLDRPLSLSWIPLLSMLTVSIVCLRLSGSLVRRCEFAQAEVRLRDEDARRAGLR